MTSAIDRFSLNQRKPKEESTREHGCLKMGFVAAQDGPAVEMKKPYEENVQVNPVNKHRQVLASRGGYSVVGDQGLFWVEDSSGKKVTKPTRGAFIAHGQLKDLCGGATAGGEKNPLDKKSKDKQDKDDGPKSEREKEDEAEERLEQIASE